MHRYLAALLLTAMLLPAGPAVLAQNVPPSAPLEQVLPELWQASITGQLEAFRAGDAAKALSFAAAPFKAQFSDPEAFLRMIIGSGYGPLIASASHSFGTYDSSQPGLVTQIVHVVAPDQKRYDALYLLTQEAGEWHIQGVTLNAAPGLSV